MRCCKRTRGNFNTIKILYRNSYKIVFNIPFEEFQWNTVIYLNLVPRDFWFFKKDSSKKRCLYIEKTELSEKETNIFETCICLLWHMFRGFLCTPPSKELKGHLLKQLKRTPSKTKWKKKTAVDIWSADALFFISSHLGRH